LLEGAGFELPVPREKHGPTAPAIITLARRWRGSAANSAPVSFLAEQGGGRRFSASYRLPFFS
jgi:hypothetical protein